MTASTRPYMGATPYPEGVTFRVWAPFARAVNVAGDFNGWPATATVLTSENNGCGSGTCTAGIGLGPYTALILSE